MIILLSHPYDNFIFSHALPHAYYKEKNCTFSSHDNCIFSTFSLIKHVCANSNNTILYPKENLYKSFRGFAKNVLSILLNNNQQKSTTDIFLVSVYSIHSETPNAIDININHILIHRFWPLGMNSKNVGSVEI